MSDILADLRYAARGLVRRPGFTAAALLLLVIGIGGGSVIATLARATFGTYPPHVEQPDRLVRITRTAGEVYAGSLAYPDYVFLRDENRTLTGLAAYDRSLVPVMARASGVMQQVDAGFVSGDYFTVLGVRPALGRMLHREDDRGTGGPRVAVISHDLWATLFDGRPDAVGARLVLGTEPFEVVGVAPQGFRGGSPSEPAPDVWVPLTLQPVLGMGEGNRFERVPGETEYWVDAIGRVRPGVEVAAVAADLGALAERMEQQYAAWNAGVGVRVSPDVRYHPDLRRRLVRTMNLLTAAAATILLIACANVALLLLARGAGRGREMGIRRSLGAGRGRIVRQLMIEAGVLALLGAAGGIVLAGWISRPVGLALLDGVVGRFEPDLLVVGATALVAVVAVIVFGLVPSVVVSRPGILELLKTDTGAGGRVGRFRATLVVTQVALSLVLVSCATLLVRSVRAAQSVRLGFAAEHRLLLRVDLERQGYTEARGRAFLRDALARLNALPGVEAATLTRQVPFRGMWSAGFEAEGVTATSGGMFESGANAVGPGYFAAMGIPVVAGREFRDSDDDGAPFVAVVNETLARTIWGDANPLGRVIGRGGALRFTVVGVVHDALYYDLGEPPQPQLYVTPLQFYRPALDILVRTAGNPGDLTGSVVNALRGIEPALVVGRVSTLAEVVDAQIRPYRTLALAIGAVGVLALALAALGLYGVLSYLVTQRTREFGIRLALGARAGRIASDLVVQGTRLAVIGILVGSVGAWLGTRLVGGFLFAVDAHDPLALVLAPLALAAAAVAASVVPARRAGSVQPMEALRYE